MRVPSALRWWLLALAGLAVAIAVAFAASELASERIGLASEPVRAGESLAPAAGRSERPGDREPGTAPVTTTPAPTQTTTPTPAQTTTPASPAQTTESSEAGEPTETASEVGEGEGEDD